MAVAWQLQKFCNGLVDCINSTRLPLKFLKFLFGQFSNQNSQPFGLIPKALTILCFSSKTQIRLRCPSDNLFSEQKLQNCGLSVRFLWKVCCRSYPESVSRLHLNPLPLTINCKETLFVSSFKAFLNLRKCGLVTGKVFNFFEKTVQSNLLL